jgi:hypothetical protein
MIQYEAMRLIHRHGDRWEPMVPAEHSADTEHDIERSLARGDRLFRCIHCDDVVAVRAPQPNEADAPAE